MRAPVMGDLVCPVLGQAFRCIADRQAVAVAFDVGKGDVDIVLGFAYSPHGQLAAVLLLRIQCGILENDVHFLVSCRFARQRHQLRIT